MAYYYLQFTSSNEDTFICLLVESLYMINTLSDPFVTVSLRAQGRLGKVRANNAITWILYAMAFRQTKS